MTNEEETYKVTIHLINGTKHRVSYPVTATELGKIYKTLGTNESRIKYPTRGNVMQFLPASSVLRIEAKGRFE